MRMLSAEGVKVPLQIENLSEHEQRLTIRSVRYVRGARPAAR